MAAILPTNTPGLSVYAKGIAEDGRRYNADSGDLEAYNAGHEADYVLAATEQGASGIYVLPDPTIDPADLPALITWLFYNEADDSLIGLASTNLDADGNEVRGGDASLANQLIMLGRLTAGRVVVQSALADDNTLQIVRGDSYLDADGRALTWTAQDYLGPAIGSLTVQLRLVSASYYDEGETVAELAVAGDAVATGDDVTVTVELTAAQTAGLTLKPYKYQLVGLNGAGTKVHTFALGPVELSANIPTTTTAAP